MWALRLSRETQSELSRIEIEHSAAADYPGQITRRQRQEMLRVEPCGDELSAEKGHILPIGRQAVLGGGSLAGHQPAGGNRAKQRQIGDRACCGLGRLG